MNLKKKLKKIFAFARRDGGFTLVELIVVIAILGILAGVGTVGYSGYIKKANLAADQVLLDSLNTAFAAACIENGVPNTDVGANDISLTDKKVDEADIVLTHAKAADIETDFWGYYKGGEFKVMTALNYVDGRFEDASVGSMRVAYGGGYIYLNESDLAALKNASFLDALGGVGGVLDKVDNVASLATPIIDGMIDKLLGDEKFMNHAAEAMGINPSEFDSEEDFQMALYNKANELADQMEGVDHDEAFNKVMANAIVLHAAQNASQSGSKEGYLELLTSENAAQTISNNINSGEVGEAYSQAAVAYGMITAYAHATGKPDLIEGDNLINVVTSTLNDPNFRDWMKTDQAKTDMDGYLAAMNMVNNSSKDQDAVSTLLVNGFNDDELKNVFGGVLGD